MRDRIFTESFVNTVDRWDGSMLGPSRDNRRLEGVQVFESRWFERYFATAHPALPGVLWGPVLLVCIYSAIAAPAWNAVDGITRFALGLLAWTLVEYLLHRYLFHLQPPADLDGKIKQFMMHGYHHEFPNDRRRLVAPIVLSVPIAIPLASLYVWIFGRYEALMWFSGTLVGYLAYDWIHYYTHHFRPKSRLGKFIRRYHMEHHYLDSESHFGISSPLWDWVFGTARSKTDAQSTPGQAATR